MLSGCSCSFVAKHGITSSTASHTQVAACWSLVYQQLVALLLSAFRAFAIFVSARCVIHLTGPALHARPKQSMYNLFDVCWGGGSSPSPRAAQATQLEHMPCAALVALTLLSVWLSPLVAVACHTQLCCFSNCSPLQARHWRATYSFPRCARDLFATGLQLVGLPGPSRNEAGLRAALCRYGAVTSAQVRGEFGDRGRIPCSVWLFCSVWPGSAGFVRDAQQHSADMAPSPAHR
jgi:hypothetical protein